MLHTVFRLAELIAGACDAAAVVILVATRPRTRRHGWPGAKPTPPPRLERGPTGRHPSAVVKPVNGDLGARSRCEATNRGIGLLR